MLFALDTIRTHDERRRHEGLTQNRFSANVRIMLLLLLKLSVVVFVVVLFEGSDVHKFAANTFNPTCVEFLAPGRLRRAIRSQRGAKLNPLYHSTTVRRSATSFHASSVDAKNIWRRSQNKPNQINIYARTMNASNYKIAVRQRMRSPWKRINMYIFSGALSATELHIFRRTSSSRCEPRAPSIFIWKSERSRRFPSARSPSSRRRLVDVDDKAEGGGWSPRPRPLVCFLYIKVTFGFYCNFFCALPEVSEREEHTKSATMEVAASWSWAALHDARLKVPEVRLPCGST